MMGDILGKYASCPSQAEIDSIRQKAEKRVLELYNTETLKKIHGLLDLTSLNITDSISTTERLCMKVGEFAKQEQLKGIPNVAGICIYPAFIPCARDLLADTVRISSVASGFPSGQTLLKQRTIDAHMILDEGAGEIDMVFPVGEFLDNQYEYVKEDMETVRMTVDGLLKIILETGVLKTPEKIWDASLIAMLTGAEFIKTSTGTTEVGATPEAVIVMALAIKEYLKKDDRKVGLKPSGGIKKAKDALLYYAIVEEVLGEEWLEPMLFRIGASSLANNLLTEILSLESGQKVEVNYF